MENKQTNMRKIDLSASHAMAPPQTGFPNSQAQRSQMTPYQANSNYQTQPGPPYHAPHLNTPQPAEYNHFLSQSPYPHQENFAQNPSVHNSMQMSQPSSMGNSSKQMMNTPSQQPFQNITYNTNNSAIKGDGLNPNFNFYASTKHMVTPSVSASMMSTHRTEFQNSFLGGITANVPKTFSDSYENQVPVRIRSHDRDEWVTMVTIRIQITTVGPHNQLVLQIELTDESDPFFLYSLECGENEFQNLKSELQLLVDFQNFPAQVIQLLDICSSNQDDSHSKYSCLLVKSQTGEGLFMIQESTQFRQMNHLQLKFKCGDDEGIKKLLAVKLKETKQLSEDYKHKLEQTEDTLGNYGQQNEVLKLELQSMREENRRISDEMKIEAQKIMNDQKEKMLLEQSEQSAQSDKDKRENSHKFDNEVGSLKQLIAELTEKCEGLGETKRELEQLSRDQGIRLESMQHNVDLMTTEVTELRITNKEMEAYKYKQEKSVTELSLTNQNLMRQLEDKDEIISKMNNLVDSNKMSNEHIIDQLATYKANNQKMEEKLQSSAQEIIKGNQIIQKLQAENKAAKQKVKMTNKVVMQQEELINKGRIDCEDQKRAYQDGSRELDRKNDEVRDFKEQVESLRFKNGESQKVLEENQKMIRWLNEQLSNQQKQTGAKFVSTMATTSSYKPSTYNSTSFKPSFSNISELNDRAGFTATGQSTLPPTYPMSTQMMYQPSSALADSKMPTMARPPIGNSIAMDNQTSYASKYTPFSMNDSSSMTNNMDTIKRSPSASSLSSNYSNTVAQYQESTLNQNFSTQNTASFNPSVVSRSQPQVDAPLSKFKLLNLEGSNFDAFSRKNCDESSEEVKEYKMTSYNAEPMTAPTPTAQQSVPEMEETMGDDDEDNILPIKYTHPTGV